MTGGESRFTSDRRSRRDASWANESDWEAGFAEDVGIVDGSLMPQGTVQSTDELDSVVIDDFEDGDLEEWHGEGKSVFSVTSTRAYAGSYALEYVNGGTATRGVVTHPNLSPSLSTYPGRGNTILAWSYHGHSDNRCQVIAFGAEGYDTSDSRVPWRSAYSVQVNLSANELRLRKVGSDGTTVPLESVPASPPVNEWILTRVDFDINGDDTIAVTLEDSEGFEIGAVSVTDGTYDGVGLGTQFNVNNSADNRYWLDQIRVA